MEDLTQSWTRLSLSEREGPGCCLMTKESVKSFSIAANFLTKRALNVEAIARTFTPLWRARTGFKIQNIGDHKILFSFDDKEDVDRILGSKQWSFDKHLVVMQRYDNDKPLQDIKYDRTTFWLQVHGLPIRYMTIEAAEKICDVVGKVIKQSDSQVYDGGLHAPPFVVSKKKTITVSGYFSTRKMNNKVGHASQPMEEEPLTQQNQTEKFSEPVHEPIGEPTGVERYRQGEKTQLLSNGQNEMNPINHVGLEISFPLTPTINEILSCPKDIDTVLNVGNDEPQKSKDSEKGLDTSRVSKPRDNPSVSSPEAMSCLAWNYRGLRNLHTSRELVEITRAKDPSMVFLAETLANDARLEIVQKSIEHDHRWVVPREGQGGGLALFWKSSINLTVIGSSKYYIDAIIDKNSEDEWQFTGFYGEPETARRGEAWEQLKYLNSQTNIPWSCIGDFNEITRQDEKLGGGKRPHNQM
uniref:DUF4283 domain-containing protein n=1 Tax=Quercus lobata TaxID=97700 RepID=A0A7N2LKW2_QUELO